MSHADRPTEKLHDAQRYRKELTRRYDLSNMARELYRLAEQLGRDHPRVKKLAAQIETVKADLHDRNI